VVLGVVLAGLETWVLVLGPANYFWRATSAGFDDIGISPGN